MKLNNNVILFFCLYTLTFCGTVLSKEILGFDKLVHDFYVEQLTVEQLNKLNSTNNLWNTITYFIMLLFLIIKVYMISIVLDTGIFFSNIKIEFRKIINIVLKAEFIFLLPIVLKIIWFGCFQHDYTLMDFQDYAPLSLLSVWQHDNIEPWYIYPLRTANLFEIAYCVILALLLTKSSNVSIGKSFAIVLCSYGIGLLIWIAIVMFLVLNIS